MEENNYLRSRMLARYSISKKWVATTLFFAIRNKWERVPIYIKNNENPCDDVFWDCSFQYEDNNIVQMVFHYRDTNIYEEMEYIDLDNTIVNDEDDKKLIKNIEDYVEAFSLKCYTRCSVSVVE